MKVYDTIDDIQKSFKSPAMQWDAVVRRMQELRSELETVPDADQHIKLVDGLIDEIRTNTDTIDIGHVARQLMALKARIKNALARTNPPPPRIGPPGFIEDDPQDAPPAPRRADDALPLDFEDEVPVSDDSSIFVVQRRGPDGSLLPLAEVEWYDSEETIPCEDPPKETAATPPPIDMNLGRQNAPVPPPANEDVATAPLPDERVRRPSNKQLGDFDEDAWFRAGEPFPWEMVRKGFRITLIGSTLAALLGLTVAGSMLYGPDAVKTFKELGSDSSKPEREARLSDALPKKQAVRAEQGDVPNEPPAPEPPKQVEPEPEPPKISGTLPCKGVGVSVFEDSVMIPLNEGGRATLYVLDGSFKPNQEGRCVWAAGKLAGHLVDRACLQNPHDFCPPIEKI